MTTNPFHATHARAARPPRLRRSCLAVPGSDTKMLAKAAEVEADEVFLDLEDAVASGAKASARRQVVESLAANDYAGKVVVARVNDVTTRHCHDDVIALVRGAHAQLDCLMLPKVEHPGQLWFAEHLLSQLEDDLGADRPLGLEVQIESGSGSVNLTDIVRVTDRTEAVVFGPGDYAADQGVPQLELGTVDAAYPGHQWHYVMAQIVNHARSIGADAVDGPYGDYGDEEGYVASCTRARLLGFDGKWCIHPAQVPIANEQFTPTAEQLDHAEGLLQAHAEASAAGRGATRHQGKMIDEASRKMAEKLVARGRAAGMGGAEDR